MNDFLNKVAHEFQTPFKDSVLVFSVILFIILLAPVLLKRFRIPGIIGLIISGIIIGPHGLHLIEKNSAVDLFSTIGLLYIMFIAGLELDLGELKKNRSKSIVFGLLTFLLPISLGFPVCYYLLGYNFNSSFLTASMFATHTLIAYPIVSRLGIAKNEAVAITVGGTIFTDTAVLIILAVISDSVTGGIGHQFWLRLGISVLIFLSVVVFVIPKLSAWFFKRLEDEKNAHFIFVLSIVFFCAFMAELSGLEPIIGAFAAGLSLNRLIPHTSSLMNRIEFVGNSLFIPFFLISVGMLIDVGVLASGPQALIVAAALTVVALVGKWAAANITGIIFTYNKAHRRLIFGLSSAHAAATLAIILVGYNLNIIDDNILNGTIILILVTCLVASFVTESAGKRVVLETSLNETTANITYNQRILVPISNPATMERLIDFAIMIKDTNSKSPIVGLSIVEDDDMAQSRILKARNMLEKAILHAASADQQVEITTTIDQNITSGIKRVARETFVTLIIIGWPGKTKLADIIFGKNFDSLVNQTHQHVFITRFTLPLNIHHNIQLLCPQLAEMEYGFYGWIDAVMTLASRLSSKLIIHSTQETFNEIKEHAEKKKATTSLEPHLCRDVSVISNWKKGVHQNDIIVLVSSRRGGISYTPFLDILPRKLIKTFSESSLIFIYPEIESSSLPMSYISEPDSNLLEKGIELIKGAKDIFKKK